MKSDSKNINLSRAYNLLLSYVNNESIPYDDRLTIYRLVSKLSDNREFELKVNKEFSARKLSTEKDQIEYQLNNRIQINLKCDFVLIPYLQTRWRLLRWDEVFLDGLDYKMARRIAYDINVAYSLKYSDKQLSKSDV